jgi:hypothetical protein
MYVRLPEAHTGGVLRRRDTRDERASVSGVSFLAPRLDSRSRGARNGYALGNQRCK